MTKLQNAKNLDADRRIRADYVFENAYLDGDQIEAMDGWESYTGSFSTRPEYNTWTRVVYLRSEDPLEPTIKRNFHVVFKPGSCVPVEAWLGDKLLQLP